MTKWRGSASAPGIEEDTEAVKKTCRNCWLVEGEDAMGGAIPMASIGLFYSSLPAGYSALCEGAVHVRSSAFGNLYEVCVPEDGKYRVRASCMDSTAAEILRDYYSNGGGRRDNG